MIGNLAIEAAWLDAEGNHWYKMTYVGDYQPLPLKKPRYKSGNPNEGGVLPAICRNHQRPELVPEGLERRNLLPNFAIPSEVGSRLRRRPRGV